VPDSQQPSSLQRNAWLLDMAGQVSLISAIPLAVSMALAEYMHHGDYTTGQSLPEFRPEFFVSCWVCFSWG
jgi:hypothetical protein